MKKEFNEDYSLWSEGVKRNKYPKLTSNEEADVVIIGGGVTGVMSAYLLAKAGKSVILLEKMQIGQWTTICTTAFLTQSVDTTYKDLIFSFGLKTAQQIAESHGKAIDLVNDIIQLENISCDFKKVPIRLLAHSEADYLTLEQEQKSMHKVGIDSKLLKRSIGNTQAVGYLEINNQATYHPIKFVIGLTVKAHEYGAKIFEKTNAEKITKTEFGWQVSANGHTITAKEVIAATYDPFQQPLDLFFKKANYHSYVCEFDIPNGTIAEGLYEDITAPYHYFKVDELEDKSRVIFGGEDHREDIKINPAKNYQALVKHAKSFFPNTKIEPKRYWSGPILEPIDGIAYIGKDKNSQIYYAFGFSGNGLTYAAIAADILCEQISGKQGRMHNYHSTYKINRLPTIKSMLVKGKDYGSILLGGAARNIFE